MNEQDGPRDILVTWPGYAADAPDVGGELTKRGLRIRLAPKLAARTATEVIQLGQGCVGMIASTDPITEDVFDALPDLRVVARVGVGIDSIDVAAATRRGVVVTTARGMNEDTVADHTLALMLAALRRVVIQDAAVRAGCWERTVPNIGHDLHHKVVGIIGLGAIGRAVARRLRGFDVRLVAYDVSPSSSADVESVSLAELLRISDVVTVHVPLTAATRGLIGPDEMRAMKPGAVLINTSRGAVVDEVALLNALVDGSLGYAGLDVYRDEPPVNSPLLGLTDRTVLAPHVAGLTHESVRAMERHATLAVVSVLEGRGPDGLENPEVRRVWRQS